MIKNFFKGVNEFNQKVMKIINKGLLFSLGIGIIGLLLILTYNTYSVTYDIYEGGFILVKTAFAFAAQFVGFGIATNRLIKEKT